MSTKDKLASYERALRSYHSRPPGFAQHTKPLPEQFGLVSAGERCVADGIERKIVQALERKPF